MKYFEIHEPYYALMQAKDKDEALKNYAKYVANDDGTLKDEIQEVDRDYALLMFSRAPGENKVLLPVSDVINEFVEQEHKVLLIDGSLI